MMIRRRTGLGLSHGVAGASWPRRWRTGVAKARAGTRNGNGQAQAAQPLAVTVLPAVDCVPLAVLPAVEPLGWPGARPGSDR